MTSSCFIPDRDEKLRNQLKVTLLRFFSPRPRPPASVPLGARGEDGARGFAMVDLDPEVSSGYTCLNELENPGAGATALGVFSILFSTCVGIPQAYKIWRLKSSRGVSFLTLGLGNIGSFLYVLNLVILHYNQITLSLSRDFTFWVSAQRSLTFVWVELFNALSMLCIYPIASLYVVDEPCPVKIPSLGINTVYSMRDAVYYGFLVQVGVVFVAWLPAVFVFSVDGRCEPLALYGNFVGFLVGLIIVVKFLPQLRESWYARGSYSLSYLTYGVDAAAGIVAWAQKVFVTNERVSSWLPPLFLHALEIFVLCLNFYHDRAGHQDMSRRHGPGHDAHRRRASGDERDDDPEARYHHPGRGTAAPLGYVDDGGYGAGRGTGGGGRDWDTQRLLRPLSPSGMRRQRSFTDFL